MRVVVSAVFTNPEHRMPVWQRLQLLTV